MFNDVWAHEPEKSQMELKAPCAGLHCKEYDTGSNNPYEDALRSDLSNIYMLPMHCTIEVSDY